MLHKDDVRKLISYHYRRLQKLKEQEALYGLRVDPGILIEIEDIEAKIIELREELEKADDMIASPIQFMATLSNDIHGKIQETPSIFSATPWPKYTLTLPNRQPSLRDFRRWLQRK